MRIKYILVLLIILMLGCSKSKTYSIKLLDTKDFRVQPPSETYKIAIKVAGDFGCPTDMIIVQNGFNKPGISLEGRIDTLFGFDWYEDSFELNFTDYDCIDEEAFLKVRFIGI